MSDNQLGRIDRSLLLARTLPRLGWHNIMAVAAYRLACRVGWYRWRMPIISLDSEPLYQGAAPPDNPPRLSASATLDAAERALQGELVYFSHTNHIVGSPPDWFLDPYSAQRAQGTERHWSAISDFGSGVTDIKVIWEPSRWEWALLFARAYGLTADQRYLDAVNAWSADWIAKNPPNQGPNWKCGQEVAIRLINALLAAQLLERHVSASLESFVAHHCARIVSTRQYALAQQNNHGTSEAAGLFIGGSWLAEYGANHDIREQARRWMRVGREQLESCMRRLVQPDGSFSQYSLNYHRVLLDTLNMVEYWRRQYALPPFSEALLERAEAAARWLYEMIDPLSGDGPIIGANDGARLFPLSETPYRDYRPTVQLSFALFCQEAPYQAGPWDEPLHWLGLSRADKMASARGSRVFGDGGYVTLHSPAPTPRSWGVVRFPRYDTRPSHADALHFDLWVDGLDLLRDGGSYSYADDESLGLSKCHAHNTVQCDGHDQMPSIGRFLYGQWLQASKVGDLERLPDGVSWSGAYADAYGCHHTRSVSVQGHVWQIVDQVRCDDHAVLRWRLMPDAWSLDAKHGTCVGPRAAIMVQCDAPIARLALTEGWESRRYLAKSAIPVLEIQAQGQRIEFRTHITLRSP